MKCSLLVLDTHYMHLCFPKFNYQFFVGCNPVVTRMQVSTIKHNYLIEFHLHYYVYMFYIAQDRDRR